MATHIVVLPAPGAHSTTVRSSCQSSSICCWCGARNTPLAWNRLCVRCTKVSPREGPNSTCVERYSVHKQTWRTRMFQQEQTRITLIHSPLHCYPFWYSVSLHSAGIPVFIGWQSKESSYDVLSSIAIPINSARTASLSTYCFTAEKESCYQPSLTVMQTISSCGTHCN